MEMESLPALTGSPKQIEWAEEIRREHLAWLAARPIEGPDAHPLAWTVTTAGLAVVRAITDASWWINHRGSARRAYQNATGTR